MESLYCDYEILLRSLQNLGLNDHNSLVCNAAYSTTLDSSSNNFTTADAGNNQTLHIYYIILFLNYICINVQYIPSTIVFFWLIILSEKV